MSRYYRHNPDEEISHDWVTDGERKVAQGSFAASTWLERVRKAKCELEHEGKIPLNVALKLGRAVDALKAAESVCMEWQTRSNNSSSAITKTN